MADLTPDRERARRPRSPRRKAASASPSRAAPSDSPISTTATAPGSPAGPARLNSFHQSLTLDVYHATILGMINSSAFSPVVDDALRALNLAVADIGDELDAANDGALHAAYGRRADEMVRSIEYRYAQAVAARNAYISAS